MLILVLLLVLTAPATASAATVSIHGDCDRYACSFQARYVAAPGERNDLTITRPTGMVYEFHDAGAPVHGCEAVDAGTARCVIDTGALIHSEPEGLDIVDAGAGDDRIEVGSRHASGSVYRCGEGRDFVDQTQRRDFIRGDCERLAVGPTVHGTVHLHTLEPARFLYDPLRGTYTARYGRRIVARGQKSLGLNALGRRLLRQRGRLRISVELRDGVDTGGFQTELRR